MLSYIDLKGHIFICDINTWLEYTSINIFKCIKPLEYVVSNTWRERERNVILLSRATQKGLELG